MLSSNKRLAAICFGVAVGMVGLAYASVPLYRLFCQATGFAGTTQRAAAPSHTVVDRRVIVRFDANVAPGLDWEFKPLVNTVDVALGENAIAVYRATNHASTPIVGSATFNVTPEQAGAFFNKVQCFCFTEQRLEPGESVDMPVSFFVDPAMASDVDGKHVTIITLSYTFHAVPHPKAGVAQRNEGAGAPGEKGTTGVPRG